MSEGGLKANACCVRVYWCPNAMEFECPKHGGFDVCCADESRHIPLFTRTQVTELAIRSLVPFIVVASMLSALGWLWGEAMLWLMDRVWIGFAIFGIAGELLVLTAIVWTFLNVGRENELW